ncbi:phosphotransferase [Nonomuraea sp. NPDC049758]|uniref:phosphotransferase n=1 Tax=Nonomuraea sp. NPDC049758 TaxID=3154360 RepID=UPI003448F73B
MTPPEQHDPPGDRTTPPERHDPPGKRTTPPERHDPPGPRSGPPGWEDLPGALVREVERRLGRAAAGFEERHGGFTGGVRGVLTLTGGGRVFVKAVPAGSPHAADHRAEAVVGAALPPGVPAPRFLFSCEAAGWVLLCSEVAPGRIPHEPWHDDELAAALALLTACARELTPSPLGGLPTLAGRMSGRCELWNTLDPARAGAWERARLPRLAAVERRWTALVTGGTLLHFDPRFDNILIDRDGTARLVDWGRACTGPAWADLVCLLLQSDLGPRDPERLLTAHPLGRRAPADQVDALLVVLLGYWTRSATAPAPPALRDRRERSRRATLAWLRTRWP